MKKLVSILLCVMMLVSVVACGGAGDDVTTPQKNTTGTTQDTTNTTATTGTTATTQTTQATTTTTTVVTPTNVFDENNIVLSFGAVSDVHITGSGTNDATTKFINAIVQLKAQAALHDKDGLDALTIAGDIADTGKTVQVNTFTQIIKNHGLKNVMLTPGNHDYYGDKQASLSDYQTAMGEGYFANDIDKSMLEKGARHCVINGYHFIFVEPTKYSSNCPYDTEVLKWLDNTLKAITEEDPDAYVFFYTHPMIYDTCYGSDLSGGSWYTTYLTETLSKYPQVVTFGGHLHFPINDERTIMQTAFTSLGCGSVRYLAIERGYSNMKSATVPKDAYDVSSGLLVQVDANGNLRITRMDFSNKSTFKDAWELTFPQEDGSHLNKYGKDRADANKAPTLAGTPTVKANVSYVTGDVSGVTITVPAGADDDFVHHYNVTVKNQTTGGVATYKFLSDFYRHSTPATMATSMTYPLDITTPGVYTIEVVAVDSWDAESGKISCEVTIGNPSGTITSELPEVYTELDFADGKIVDTKDKFNVTVKGGTVTNTPLTFAGKTKTVGAYRVTAAGMNTVLKFKEYSVSTLSDFYNSSTGFSVEALYINYDPNSTQGIVCGTQKPGGWGLAESSGVPYFFTYIGASGSTNLSVGSKSNTAELNHIIGTFIYDSATNTTYTAIYLNGKVVKTGSSEGKVGVHGTAGIGDSFCIGGDINSTGGSNEFAMTDFVIADVKFYAHALNYKQAETAYNNAVAYFS